MSPELKKRLPLIVAGIVAVLLIVGGVIWWVNGQRWESTDNAFVRPTPPWSARSCRAA